MGSECSRNIKHRRDWEHKIALKHFTHGITKSASILFGIIVGYILCTVLALILPTTYTNAEGVEATCSWVIQWSKVADAAWFSIPKIMPVKYVFDMRAILPMLIRFPCYCC